MRLQRLTEAQVWETLARFFMSMNPGSNFSKHRGLCYQLYRLRQYDYISENVRASVFEVLSREMNRTDAFYLWDLNAAGARARGQFCWRQVRRLKRGKR